MESRTEQVVASPTWGGRRERRKAAPVRARGTPGLGLAGASARDLAGAALVLGGTAALWLTFLFAVW